MKLKNYNKAFSNEQIRSIISFVRPPGISKFDVSVKNCHSSYRGMAYSQGSSYHCSADPFIVVSINPKLKMPQIENKADKPSGYLPCKMFTLEEVLVHLIAHELRHLWQAKHKRGYRVWGARGQFSERDADAYAINRVRAWRRGCK